MHETGHTGSGCRHPGAHAVLLVIRCYQRKVIINSSREQEHRKRQWACELRYIRTLVQLQQFTLRNNVMIRGRGAACDR